MTRNDLTTTEKRRLVRNHFCPICLQKISYDEKILYTIQKQGRCKKYTFYHERCLMYGKEENKC